MDEERLAAIRELVRNTYSDSEVVARYATVGLWPAEENLVLEYFPDLAEVLDLGCGAGRTSIPLAEMGFGVAGGFGIAHWTPWPGKFTRKVVPF